MPLNLEQLDEAAALIYGHMQPSPQIEWPLLNERCGARVMVKHENHNPTGAFKVRGGLHYLSRLTEREPATRGLIAATRGNHGQSIAYAAGRFGLTSVVVVPKGNSVDKNRAMIALGAELIEYGEDFDEAAQYAVQLAEQENYHRIPSFHWDLVAGVASCGLELLRSQPLLERVYVPIGLGSGICAMACARNELGLNTEIVGVVAQTADAYAQSLEAGECRTTDSAVTLADGLAVREPNAEALAFMRSQVARIVRVSDAQIVDAMGFYFSDTHNVAEGAGAAALAALLHEQGRNTDARVAVVLSGQNVDSQLFSQALATTAVPG